MFDLDQLPIQYVVQGYQTTPNRFCETTLTLWDIVPTQHAVVGSTLLKLSKFHLANLCYTRILGRPVGKTRNAHYNVGLLFKSCYTLTAP